MKTKEVIGILLEDGWFVVNQKGSRRQFKHPASKGRVTVAGAPNEDMNPKTLKRISKQAGLER